MTETWGLGALVFLCLEGPGAGVGVGAEEVGGVGEEGGTAEGAGGSSLMSEEGPDADPEGVVGTVDDGCPGTGGWGLTSVLDCFTPTCLDLSDGPGVSSSSSSLSLSSPNISG